MFWHCFSEVMCCNTHYDFLHIFKGYNNGYSNNVHILCKKITLVLCTSSLQKCNRNTNLCSLLVVCHHNSKSEQTRLFFIWLLNDVYWLSLTEDGQWKWTGSICCLAVSTDFMTWQSLLQNVTSLFLNVECCFIIKCASLLSKSVWPSVAF